MYKLTINSSDPRFAYLFSVVIQLLFKMFCSVLNFFSDNFGRKLKLDSSYSFRFFFVYDVSDEN